MTSPTQLPLACTAVLMAGGGSVRMGRDKAWLEHQGRPLWQVQLEKLRFASEIFISARENTLTETPPGCRLIFDDQIGKGPLAGLHEALKTTKFDHVLLLAVDMPGMTSEYLKDLIEEAKPGWGIVPEVDGFFEGLAAVYPKRILSLVEDLLASDDCSFQNLCSVAVMRDLMKVRPVAEIEERLFTNWNRPEDQKPRS